MHKRFTSLIGLTAFILAVPGTADSAVLDPFGARAQVRFLPVDSVSESAGELSAVARIDPLTGDRGESGAASASASIQGLKASAFSQVMGGADGEPARVFNANASAKVQSFNDLVFTDETGAGKTHTDVSLSFFLDGSLGISGIDTFGRSFLSPTLSLDYGVGQAGLGFPPVFQQIGRLAFTDAFQTPIDNPIALATGIFADLEYRSSDLISQEFTTPTVSVPLDTILSFKMELSVSAGGTSNDGDQIGAHANFGNTLTFSPDAFFNLAPGITVNSAELGLVNNSFDPPSPIPLPAPFLLLGAALAGLGRFRRKTS
ncbi:MAG: hypothetical protein AAF387_01380 [Pseudomonadota bacterium]